MRVVQITDYVTDSELEQEQERTIGQLESDNKRLRSDVDKYKEQLEQNRFCF